MRFTLIAGSFGVLILMCGFVFLLFRTSESKKTEVVEPVRDTTRVELPIPEPERISNDTDVSRPDTEEEKPLGTDINMEFPTLDE